MKVDWADTLEALWGTPLTDKQVPVWEHYLKKLNTTGVEIQEAIEEASDTDEVIRYRATVRDLKRWIIAHRRRKRAGNAKEETARKITIFVEEWKGKVSRGVSHEIFLEALETFRNKTKIDIFMFNEISRKVIGDRC